MTLNSPGMESFVQEALAWIAQNYPDRRMRTVCVVFDDGQVLKLPVPALVYFAAESDRGGELTDIEEMVLKFMRGRKERLLAKQIITGMEKEGLGLSGSAVERALSRLRVLGYLTNINGHGYTVAEGV